MARGLNKVMLIGHLGADPETRYMPNGNAVTNIRLATTDSWKDRQTGEQQERTEWHRIVMFARLGEIAAEYLRKGSQVYVEGRLQTRKWQAQDGSDRWSTEIIANEMQMLGSRRQSTEYQDSPDPAGNWDRTPAAPPAAPPPYGSTPPASPASPAPPAPPAAPAGHPPNPVTYPSAGAVPPGPSEPSGASDNFDDDVPF